MTKNRNRIVAALCSYLGIVPNRFGYGLLAIAIALIHICYSVTNVHAGTPAALIQQGKIAYDRGDFPTALKLWEQAEAGYRQAGDSVGVVGSQIDRSQALMAMGMDRRACKLLTGTVGVSESVCEADISKRFGMRQPNNLPAALQALAIANLGDVLRRLGNFDAAQVTLTKAMEIATPLTAGDRATILVSIANTLRDLGTRDRDRTERLQSPSNPPLTCPIQPTGSLQATAYYQLAIACYQQAGTLTADLDLLSLQVDISQWHRDEAVAQSIASSWQNQFNQSALIKQIADRLPSNYTYAGSNQRINFARSLVLATLPQWEAATELLNTVITKSRLANQQLVSIEATGTLGWLYEQNRQWSKAEEFTRQALGATDNDNQYQWEWQLGRILQHQSQPDFAKSQAAYDRAILALEKTRRNIQIVNPDAQFSLRDNVEPLYREIIDLSLRRQQPLSKIIDRVDALKLVELENFLQCQLDVYKPINKFAEDAGTVVFYPIILADRLEVILQLPEHKFERFVVPITRIELEKTIATFRQNLTQPQYGWNDVAASQLYDWLIRPAQQYLTSQTQQLVFVLDGALQNIPVAALYDRSRQEYLIDRYPIAVTPGLQLLGAKRSVGNRSGILIGGLTASTTNIPKGKRGDIYEPLAYSTSGCHEVQ